MEDTETQDLSTPTFQGITGETSPEELITNLIGDDIVEANKVLTITEDKEKAKKAISEAEAIKKAMTSNMYKYNDAFKDTLHEIQFGPKEEKKE